jgi:hypothetical protein
VITKTLIDSIGITYNRIALVGHSMGGAHAIMMSTDSSWSGVDVITFGCPKFVPKDALKLYTNNILNCVATAGCNKSFLLGAGKWLMYTDVITEILPGYFLPGKVTSARYTGGIPCSAAINKRFDEKVFLPALDYAFRVATAAVGAVQPEAAVVPATLEEVTSLLQKPIALDLVANGIYWIHDRKTYADLLKNF